MISSSMFRHRDKEYLCSELILLICFVPPGTYIKMSGIRKHDMEIIVYQQNNKTCYVTDLELDLNL